MAKAAGVRKGTSDAVEEMEKNMFVAAIGLSFLLHRSIGDAAARIQPDINQVFLAA
jgi:hypothetical protein